MAHKSKSDTPMPPAAFTIVPRKAKAKDGAGSISFSISGMGVEYDHVRANVRVAMPGEAVGPAAARVARPIPPVPKEPPAALAISVASVGGRLAAAFQPHDEELVREFQGRHLASDGSLRWFPLGATSFAPIEQLARQTYVRLRALVEQDATRRALPDVAALSAAAQYSFNEAESRAAIASLHGLGTAMYDTLFYQGGPALAAVMMAIEATGGRRKGMCIAIYAQDVFLPWQLLHPGNLDDPGASPDPRKFWGFRYDIGVIPLSVDRAEGRLPGAMPRPLPENMLVARYRGDAAAGAAADAVAELSRRFADTVRQRLVAPSADIVKDGAAFRNALQARRSSLRLLWAFTHASAGTTGVAVAAAEPALAADVVGQRLIFATADMVTPMEMQGVALGGSIEAPYFTDHPLIMLNGCETGTGGIVPTTSLSFQGVFLNKGARGVIVTEAPVWAAFGYSFGDQILQKLLTGAEVGQALREVRLDYLNGSRNPLGLLYSYYGNAAARLVP